MHEMGIAMQIVEIAIASIPDDLKNARIGRVNLKVGKLAAVVPESLHFCFQIATQDTPLYNADLHIEEIIQGCCIHLLLEDYREKLNCFHVVNLIFFETD